MNNKPPDAKWTTILAWLGVALLLISVVGARVGLPPFPAMLGITFALLFGLIVLIITAVGLFKGGPASIVPAGWIGSVLGLLALYKIVGMFTGGGPPIHDISTDIDNPPPFVAIAPLRADAPNPAEYLDDGTAEAQASAYPDIQTVVLATGFDESFAAAVEAAESMGWEIIAIVPGEGRIEATATTTFVGFKDDIVIRVQPGDAGTLVDIRSKSRIGKGDMGVNAARIREYSAKLRGS